MIKKLEIEREKEREKERNQQQAEGINLVASSSGITGTTRGNTKQALTTVNSLGKIN